MENNLKQLRERKSVSRYRMAHDLNMQYTTLSNWEKALDLAPSKVKKCAEYLNVKPSEIIKY